MKLPNFLFVSASIVMFSSSSVRLQAASSGEQALRTRVDQFYSALEKGDMRHVERFLTPDSKPVFRAQPLTPAHNYRIISIKLDSDGTSALVTIDAPASLPMIDQPIPMARKTRWRLIKGAWYLELENSAGKPPESPFTNAPDEQTTAAPRIPAFAKDLKFQTLYVGLSPTHHSEVKLVRYPFTNVSDHVVTIGEVQTGCDCLELKTQQKVFKPGEGGVLEFRLDASKLHYDGALTVTMLVKTQPENAYNRLALGTVLVSGQPEAAAPEPAHP